MQATLAAVALLLGLSAATQAATIAFDLLGKGGIGLLSTNENGGIAGIPGSGGETGPGITFDDVTNILTMRVGFGSGSGFTDLTGAATAAHLHGLTPSSGAIAFLENAGVKYSIHTLTGWNPSPIAGGFNGVISIQPADVEALLAGRLYMNVHTATNPGGEIRGNLWAVPEPGSAGLACVAAGLALLRRRRSRDA